MTTQAIGNGNLTSLEELVGRLIDALRWEKPPAQEPGLVRGIHEARRLRRAGDIEGALGLLGGAETAGAAPAEVRWAYTEWLNLVRKRFGGFRVMVYGPGTDRAGRWTKLSCRSP